MAWAVRTLSSSQPQRPVPRSPAPRSPSPYSLKLFRPVADVSAGVAGALPQIPCSADFRAEPAGDAFCDVARAGVFGTVVLGSANHRLVVVVGVAEFFLGNDVFFRPGLRVDVAEYPGTHTVVFSHCGLPTRSNRKAGAMHKAALLVTVAHCHQWVATGGALST